ncbi:MAG: 30S ribosomal protein S8 [Candidatus Lernaella stagnicola]|nr:30S ribosomal protein S8 [Candidatus Lernaella stagnicola]
MVMTDPLADMFTRIRNAGRARHDMVEMPASKVKAAVAKILKDEGYIKAFRVIEDNKQGVLKIYLRYRENGEPTIAQIRRISRPGLRRYVSADELPEVLGGLGLAIVTTSRGVISAVTAGEMNIGGEWLAEVW